MGASPAIHSECDPQAERRWIEAARAGDTEAFRRVVEIYRDRVFALLFRMVRQYEEAEDLAQETFVRAWRNLHRYDARRPFRTWLFTIARHLALNALRRPRAQILSIDAAAEDGARAIEPAATDPLPDERAAARERQQQLEQALAQLTPRAAMVFTLFYQEGMSVAEIAQTAQMTTGAVKVALHRARETLRRRLNEARLPQRGI